MELIHNIKDGVFIIKNVFPEELIDYCLNEMQNAIDNKNFRIRMGYVINGEEYVNINEYYTDCNTDIIERFENESIQNYTHKLIEHSIKKQDAKLLETLLPYYKKALKLIYNEYDESQFSYDESDLFKYCPGNFMKKHVDNVQNLRLCTTVLYLNNMEDTFKGGEVLFYNSDANHDVTPIFEYRPNRGDLIIMDSSERTQYKGIAHSVNRIENWDRYVNRVYWNKIK